MKKKKKKKKIMGKEEKKKHRKTEIERKKFKLQLHTWLNQTFGLTGCEIVFEISCGSFFSVFFFFCFWSVNEE